MEGIRRVLLADTGEEFRLGFAAAVENEPDIQIIGQTGDGEELLRLMKLVAARGGIVTAHTRSRSLPYYGHSQDFLDGLREFLDLGRESGARIHVSHIQSGYTVTPAHDGLIRSAVSETLKELDRARQAGVNVT